MACAKQGTIVVAGSLAQKPRQGGHTWQFLQYLLGLRRLGCDVHFIEPLPSKSLHPRGSSLEDSANCAYFRGIAKAFDLEDRASLLLSGTRSRLPCNLPLSRELLRSSIRRVLLDQYSPLWCDM